jgi:SAM-dependent methyltransferase
VIVTQQQRIKEGWTPYGKLERWQDYYHVVGAASDHEDFWHPQADPDGKVRDRTSDAERRQYLEDIAEEVDFVNALVPQNVLDFGAGLGWFLSAIECPHKMAVEICPQATRYLENSGITVWESLAHVPTNSADTVIAYHVFEHLTDPIAAIAHIHRILQKPGWLILGTPDFHSPCAVRFGKRYRLLHPTHCSLFTLESMSRFLRDNAFEVYDIRFPFPSRYATAETFLRWNDTQGVSPPWPGNFVTFYARRL